MQLADFIVRNIETILRDWEEFASSLMPAAASMTSLRYAITRNRF